jgi:hypothetical protein
MKRKRLTLLASVLAMTLLFVGCKKEKPQTSMYVFNESDFGKYSKEIVVTDAKGENSAVLLVGSNDKSYLDLWTEKNFELIPVKYGENTMDVLKAFYEGRKQTSKFDENIDETDTGKEIFTMFISKNLKEDVETVLLCEKVPENCEKGWKYGTHYSYGLDAGGTITCRVYGANFWWWGYYGLEWRPSVKHEWSTIVSEWKQVGRHDVFTHSKTGCYQMKATRKYNGSPESVTIEFRL